MKKFNFKINNFYSIFNQMSDSEKNIDSYLDNKIRQVLSDDVSQNFTYELMKRIDLENEFAKEDDRTQRIAKYIIGGLISFLAAFVAMFTFILNSNEDSRDAGLFKSLVDKFSDIIESVSIMTAENLGFAFNFQTGIIILLIMVCVFIFSFADRNIIKKRI